MTHSLPYPHHVNHETKIVSIYFESGFPTTMATYYIAKTFYPGYTGQIVSLEALTKLQNS
jgi:hypothetical protein